nr:hypothetical protein [Tanacetum cinerariifolium]
MSNLNNSNQQTLADSGANERPPMLERGNYIPWESRFRRFLDNKHEEGERMCYSIQNGPYVRPMIPDPDGAENINGTVKQILEPLSKVTEANKKQYIADMKVMNYLLQAIPNDIYNSVDASKESESLESVYERLTMLVNIMDHNNVRPILVSINTKFLNCFWVKGYPADGNAETVPSYDAKAVSEVNDSSKVHEQMCHEKRKIIIQTSDDNQIDSNIIFNDPYVENNSSTSDHDSNDHDEYHKI